MRRQPPRRRQTPPKPTSYAGPTTCLRCEDVFESWDRRQNRLCPRCREAIAAEPSDEPAHDLPRPLRRSNHVRTSFTSVGNEADRVGPT
jgi:hypothetical protein